MRLSRGEMVGRLLDRLRDFIQSYRDSFERGRRKHGVWWLVFTGALFFIIMILITFAAVLYFIILPSLRSA
jgi:ABC-type multidrug transport system permease subunit